MTLLLKRSQHRKRLRIAKPKVKVLVFSNKKNYHVDNYDTRRTSIYMAKSSEAADPTVKSMGMQQFPAKALMLGCIWSDSRGFTSKF